MAKNKGTRILVTLKCIECKDSVSLSQNNTKNRKKITYSTTKNRRNTPERLELKKFCPNCNTHTIHREIK